MIYFKYFGFLFEAHILNSREDHSLAKEGNKIWYNQKYIYIVPGGKAEVREWEG